MKQRSKQKSGKDGIELPGNMHPVLALLAFLPLVTAIMIMLALFVEETPFPLIVLFVFVLGCCVLLSWTALQMLLGGKLTFDDAGLTVHRLFSTSHYPWPSVEGCKVMPATGTFGDDPLTEMKDRVGLGLFLRGLDRKREHDLDADEVLCAARSENVQRLMQIAGKVQTTLKQANGPATRAPSRPIVAGMQRQSRTRQSGERRTSSPPADPVKAFRNRASAK